MEYSVSDLVKMLLRRWYVILLTIAVFAGVSYPLAMRSYEAAVENYEHYTAQQMPIEAQNGSLEAEVCIRFQVANIEEYVAGIENKRDFVQQYTSAVQDGNYEEQETLNVYADAQAAYDEAVSRLGDIVLSDEVFDKVDLTMGGNLRGPAEVDLQGNVTSSGVELTARQCITPQLKSASVIHVSIGGVTENTARTLLEAYLSAVTSEAEVQGIDIQTMEPETEYTQTSGEYTELAELAQDVMEKPTQAPQMVRTVGTAAVFGFVIGCFFVLLGTFLYENHRLNRRDQKPLVQ